VNNHPGEKDFETISGKKPAHYDHVKKSLGGQEEHGGPEGFNLQDGYSGGSTAKRGRPRKEPSEPPRPAIPGNTSRNATEGGQDFTVPPFVPTNR